ncbi:MAG: sugar phosphate nucleotidyltransferase [Chloroflexota bacterium]
MDNITAIILAGGKGKRMDILCHHRPKPILPFAGKFRVIDFSLSNCIYSQFNDIAVLTDYQRSYMANYLNQWHLINARSSNFSVLEPKAGSYAGTADAVYQNLEYLNKRKPDTVIILAGDHVYKLDYRKMLALHQQVKADVTIGIIKVPIEQAHRFGTVALDSELRITDFQEKSPTPLSDLASMGIYIFNKEILARYLIEDAGDAESRHDFGYSILPRVVKKNRVFAYKFQGYWQDIGTVEAYYQANMELIKEKTSFSLDGSYPVLTQEDIPSTPQINNRAGVSNSLVSAGCVVKGYVENSILSSGVWVDEQAVIKNSVIMENTFIGYHSIVDRCVLDEGVNIGGFCYIGFGSNLIQDGSDITILGKGVSVPPHTAIGRSCKILPLVGPPDFPSNVVASGNTVSKCSAVRVLQD